MPPNAGGAGRYVIELAGALAAISDVSLVLWARTDDGVRWRRVAPGSEVRAVAPVRRPVRLAWEQARLAALVGRYAADMHHGPHYTMPARVRVPSVVTIHDLTFVDHPEWHQPAKRLFFRRAIQAAAIRADALVAVSQSTADRLAALFQPRGPVHVIPHGVDHARFHPRSEPGADEAALNRLRVTEPYVAFIGTLEPRKDVPTLVRAFDRMAGAHPDLSLVVAGASGWGREAINEAVAASRHRSRIQLLGWIDEADKPALLRKAAVVAYPSLEEGFGLPALEALACGAPVVTTRGSAMEEVVGGVTLLVDPVDIDALAAAIEATVEGSADVERRRGQGLELAARYTWQASAEAHVSVYRSVA